MGGGSYNVYSRTVRASTKSYATKSVDQIFTAKTVQLELNPKGVDMRECCDSEEHPNTIPVMIFLDVTGSMGEVPRKLIVDGLPKIMGHLMQQGLVDAQLFIGAIGDHEYDKGPLQVSQFEASDELIDKWIEKIWVERGGGGNAGESYLLAWYFAARHTKIDSYDKRGKKGIVITIGDEPTLSNVPGSVLENLTGRGQQSDVTADQLMKEASEKFELFHVNIGTYSGNRPHVLEGWKQLLGDNAIHIEDITEVDHAIANIVADVAKKQEAGTTESKTSQTPQVEENEDEISDDAGPSITL